MFDVIVWPPACTPVAVLLVTRADSAIWVKAWLSSRLAFRSRHGESDITFLASAVSDTRTLGVT